MFVALLIAAAVAPAQAQRRTIRYLPNYENEPYHFGFLLAYNQMMYTIKTVEDYQNIPQPNDSWPNGTYSIPNTECMYVYNVETRQTPGFTVGILAFLRSAAPSFGIETAEQSGKVAPAIGLVAALIAACPLGLLATGDAWGEWGLEDLAEMVGYEPAGLATGWEWSSFMPDYSVGALPEVAGYIVSAIIGVALLVIIFRLAAGAMRPEVDFS